MAPLEEVSPSRRLVGKPDISKEMTQSRVQQEQASKANRTAVTAAAERPRQTRARAPRARTGCKECKRRHIKCDEGKPSCKRCLISGRVCEGLAYSGVAANAPMARTTQGNAIDRGKMIKEELWRFINAPVPAAPSDAVFDNVKERDYFCFFLRMGTSYDALPETSIQLLTPQIARLVPAVKEVCCGVGALGKFLITSGRDAAEVLGDSSHHYSRAAAMLRSCDPTNLNLMGVCVASLMFTTFEMLGQQPELAISHYKHACLIFEQCLVKRSQDAGVPIGELTFTALERAISDTLQRMSTYPWSVNIPLVEMPTKDRRLMTCCRGRPYTDLLLRMPASFESMTTSAAWWDATQHFIMHHTRQGRTGGGAEQKMSAQCVDILHHWHASFRPLLERTRRDFHSDDAAKPDSYMHGLILETLYLESMAGISKYHLDDANILPDVKPLFLEMVRATRSCIPSLGPLEDIASPSEKYLLRPIAYVLLKCSAPDVISEIHEALMDLRHPGACGQVLLAVVGGMTPASLLRGWAWDFLTTGCATVSLAFGKETTLGQARKSPQTYDAAQHELTLPVR